MEWISVTDRLPDTDDEVLAVCSGKFENCTYINAVLLTFVEKGTFFDVETDEDVTSGVSHWMELPEPPEEEA